MYLRHMAKFISKLAACYTCNTACQKSCIEIEVSYALWAKLNHKNIHIIVYVLQM